MKTKARTGSRKTRSRSPASTPSADRFKELDKRAPLAAAQALDLAFTWTESREGFDYWHAIHLRLCQIADADQTYGFATKDASATPPESTGPREMIANDIGLLAFAFQRTRERLQAEFDAAHPSLWSRFKAWLT